jgi:hypothetical protein
MKKAAAKNSCSKKVTKNAESYKQERQTLEKYEEIWQARIPSLAGCWRSDGQTPDWNVTQTAEIIDEFF